LLAGLGDQLPQRVDPLIMRASSATASSGRSILEGITTMPRYDSEPGPLGASAQRAEEAIQQIRDNILVYGFSAFSGSLLGLPDDFDETLSRTYFNDQVLSSDVPDIPEDRKRARDVIYYEWHSSRLDLSEHDTIVIKNRGNIPGERKHSRVQLLDNEYGRAWVEACLSLIPVSRRSNRGTFGVNLFRTFTQVVTKPHQDDEEYIIIYVLDKVGTGAESYLYSSDNPEKLLFSSTLQPGEGLIFKDQSFLHGATALVAPEAAHAQRDALVCTVDYLDTYLSETS
jgi:hypothetical protein